MANYYLSFEYTDSNDTTWDVEANVSLNTDIYGSDADGNRGKVTTEIEINNVSLFSKDNTEFYPNSILSKEDLEDLRKEVNKRAENLDE